jgi:hypothetical protein
MSVISAIENGRQQVMTTNKGARRRVAVATAVAALTIGASLPAAASADVVGDVVNGIGLGEVLGTGGEQGAGQTPGAGSGSGSTSTPHAQGTVAKVDLEAPEGTDDGGLLDTEEVVIGRSGAQQNADGSYEGGVTLVSLFDQLILGIDTDTGETIATRFQPVHDLLSAVCEGSGNNICLTLLGADSSTDGSGSSSSFGVATADIGQGEQSISAGVGESDAALRDDGICQTASASSTVARADVAGQLNGTILHSETGSAACQGAAGSQTGDSSVAELNGNTLPLPGGCSDSLNSGFGVLSLVEVSCRNSEGSGGAAGAGGSNEAVGVSALGEDALAGNPVGDALAGAPLPSAETRASTTATSAAPPDGTAGSPEPGGDPTAGSPEGPGQTGGPGGPGDDGDDTELTAAPVGDDPVSLDDDGQLAFTGLDVSLLIGLGLALIGAGALVMGTRRRLS